MTRLLIVRLPPSRFQSRLELKRESTSPPLDSPPLPFFRVLSASLVAHRPASRMRRLSQSPAVGATGSSARSAGPAPSRYAGGDWLSSLRSHPTSPAERRRYAASYAKTRPL